MSRETRGGKDEKPRNGQGITGRESTGYEKGPLSPTDIPDEAEFQSCSMKPMPPSQLSYHPKLRTDASNT